MARSERRFSPVGVLLGIFLLLIAGTTARGQSTAAFQGTVLDAQGGAVAGAKVTVKNLGTGLERSTETDSTGNLDRKSTRLNSSHGYISYAVFCLKKKKNREKKLA